MPKRNEELREKIELAAEIAEEIAGPVVEAAVTKDDPNMVRIVYPDGHQNRVTKQVAKELVARGQAKVL